VKSSEVMTFVGSGSGLFEQVSCCGPAKLLSQQGFDCQDVMASLDSACRCEVIKDSDGGISYALCEANPSMTVVLRSHFKGSV
jgi:hypothetical protein